MRSASSSAPGARFLTQPSIDGVSLSTAALPAGWRDRLVKLQNANTAANGGTPRFTGWCLEPHDLCVAKLVALRGRDANFLASLLAAGATSPPERHRRRNRRILMFMRSPVALVLGLALAAVAATACGSDEDPVPHPQVTASGSMVRLVNEADADLVLYVSNQSFEDGDVGLKLTVDGVTVVDGEFHVEGQHSWIRFPLDLLPGRHSLSAESDTGATLTESFEVPGNEPRYAVVNYWTEDDTPELTWTFQREPVGFA